MALEYYEKCLSIKQKFKGKDSLDCANVIKSIAMTFSDLKLYKNSLSNYFKFIIKNLAQHWDIIKKVYKL